MAIVTGLANVLRNYKKAVTSIINSSSKATKKIALRIEADSNEIVPKEFGVLVNSSFTNFNAFTRKAGVGYTASYAGFVHEMPEDYNYTSPGTGPKFLKKAIDQNMNDIIPSIQDGIRLDTGIRFRVR
jgi:hypothetical protein